MSSSDCISPATTAVRAGINSDTQHGAVVPPMHLSSTFNFDGFNGKRQYDYTRSGNPTRDQLARALADLERGAGAVITSTGMAAITLVLHLLEPDDLLIAPHDCYGGTYRLISALARKQHFRARFVDQHDPAAVAAAIASKPRMLWIENPSNPLLRVTDVVSLAKLGHEARAIVVVDNTFLSPALQRPIELGADIVVHSTTKYLNGHSDVVGGAVVVADETVLQDVAWWANCLGITGAPFDSFLTLRGLRTLHARMRIHLENAVAILELLHSHPAVQRIYYPGTGAMISFEVAGGEAGVRAVVDNLKLFTLAESLGGVESLIAHPATMTHAAMDADARRIAGINDSLLRLSVGIEDGADLIRDLGTGLDAVLTITGSTASVTHDVQSTAVRRVRASVLSEA